MASLNGVNVDIGEKTPEIKNSTMMLPLDLCVNQFGAVCEINGQNIYFEINDTIYESDIGSAVILINGQPTELTEAFYAENNTVYVPLRQIFENAGWNVRWNDLDMSVEISTP